MAGFWHLSHSQLHDANGRPLAGARAYFFAADTLVPLIVYQDYSLALPHPSPVVADGLGFFPPVFLDEGDGFYRQRITNSAGVIVAGSDVVVLPIIGPTGGGEGADVPVDANSLFTTGDLMWTDADGTRAGWVRDNGRTIGSATSGATERANSDTEALFLFLWGRTDCPLVGGSGITAAADWAANKQITLPDKRCFSPAGLATMGNSASTALANVPTILGGPSVAGGKSGAALHTLTTAESAAHRHAALFSEGLHNHGGVPEFLYGSPGTGGSGGYGTGLFGTSTGNNVVSSPSVVHDGAGNVNVTGLTGGGGAHNNTPLVVFGTFFRKL